MEVIQLDKNEAKYTIKLTEEELTMIFNVFTELADSSHKKYTSVLSQGYRTTNCFKD